MSVLWWLLVPLAYLVGSIPWGVMVGKVTRGVDVRQYGSGKTGMANVLRTVGVGGAILVVVGDVAKGAVPVLLARLLTDSPTLATAVAVSALVGHNWSIFIRFQGGRGIFTGFGALTPLVPLASAAALVGIPIIALFRYVSLGSLIATSAAMAVAVALYVLGQLPLPYLLYTLVGGTIIIGQHRDNIVRLARGTERRLGERATPRSSPQGN